PRSGTSTAPGGRGTGTPRRRTRSSGRRRRSRRAGTAGTTLGTRAGTRGRRRARAGRWPPVAGEGEVVRLREPEQGPVAGRRGRTSADLRLAKRHGSSTGGCAARPAGRPGDRAARGILARRPPPVKRSAASPAGVLAPWPQTHGEFRP